MRRLLAAVPLFLALLPRSAEADPDHVVCVSELDPGPAPTCSLLPCGTVHPTLEDGLAEAAALPDIAGGRPEVHICIGVGLDLPSR